MCFAGQPCALGCAWGRPAASTTTSFDQPGGSGRIHQPACGATCYAIETTNGSSTTHHSRGSVDTSKCGQVCSKTKRGGACIRMVRTCTLLLSYCRARRSRSRSRGSGRSHRSGRRGRRSRSKSAHSRRSKKSRRRSRSGSRHRSRKHKRRHHSSSSTSSRSYSPERHGRHKETKSRHDSRARYDQHGYVHEYPQQQQHQAYQQQGFGEC